MKKALLGHDEDFIRDAAEEQARKGAGYIDVNVATGKGSPGQEKKDMGWAVRLVQEASGKPVAIDTTDPAVLEAGLQAHQGQAMINSITGEKDRLEDFLKLAGRYQSLVIALPISDRGIPPTPEERLEVCHGILEEAQRHQVPPSHLYFDPLVLPVSVETGHGLRSIETLEGIKKIPGVKTTLGLSNISYGMPQRKLLNRAFLALCLRYLDSAILDPLDQPLVALLRAGNTLLGKDKMCMDYLKAYRRGELG